MNAKEIIINEINNNVISTDGSEIFFYQNGSLLNIAKDELFKIREINNLDRNTAILYARFSQSFTEGDFWSASKNEIWSTIFLEDRISIRHIIESKGWSKGEDAIIDIYWDEIDEVDVHCFHEDTDEKGQTIKHYLIRFFSNIDNEITKVLTDYLLLKSEKDSLEFVNLINKILESRKKFLDSDDDELNLLIDNIRTKTIEEDFQNVINLINENFDLNLVKEENSIIYYFLVYHHSRCLKGLKKNQEALKFLEERIIKNDVSEGYEDWNFRLFELKAEIFDELGNYYKSLENYYFASENTQEIEIKSDLNDKINYSYNKFTESFNNLQYDKRKMILIYDEVKISPSDSFIVLDKSNLPVDIKFPLTHPKKEEIYVGHPYLKESYLPYSSFEADLFNDRFEEFSYFIQCLGAKSMTIKVIKENEKTTTEIDNKKTGGSIGLGKKVIKNTIEADYENNRDSDKKEDSKTSRIRTQNYNPTKKPYVPGNLLWYPHETSWHRIYQQRINGNILSHHDIISSKSTHSISNNEKSNLKVGLKTFFSDVNLNRDTFIKNTIDESESIEWEIFVEFESLENLLENEESTISFVESSTFSDAENQYKEEVIFMLEDDGIIDEKERRILNRLKDKLKISDERAKFWKMKFQIIIHKMNKNI
ncbi:hypothetical protein [Flavobacterium tegetincola]|uniref:hypothetical protein n=1 Tax=Flavobacterium tegetincola TaxID=150172 RepID=UPI00041DBC7A|nr:hypothetical protein [Flavobacterium tegetincola]